MLEELKSVAAASPETLIKDFLGGSALVLLLVAGLYLPGLV